MIDLADGGGLHEGLNAPTAVDRVLVLDWYDGPTAGFLQAAADKAVFRFELLDRRQSGDEPEVRVFGLYPVPKDSLQQLSAAIEAYQPAHWPVWCPVWQFPTDQIRAELDRMVESVVGQSGPLTWIVVGSPGSDSLRALAVHLAKAS